MLDISFDLVIRCMLGLNSLMILYLVFSKHKLRVELEQLKAEFKEKRKVKEK